MHDSASINVLRARLYVLLAISVLKRGYDEDVFENPDDVVISLRSLSDYIAKLADRGVIPD